MPGFTGLELAKQVREITLDLPIILCTGYSEVLDTREAEKLGIKKIIQKPISMLALAKEIRNTLDSPTENNLNADNNLQTEETI